MCMIGWTPYIRWCYRYSISYTKFISLIPRKRGEKLNLLPYIVNERTEYLPQSSEYLLSLLYGIEWVVLTYTNRFVLYKHLQTRGDHELGWGQVRWKVEQYRERKSVECGNYPPSLADQPTKCISPHKYGGPLFSSSRTSGYPSGYPTFWVPTNSSHSFKPIHKP